MVFKKPYGFLIKHFKLIHLIITFILGLVVYRCNSIYAFLNDCIEDSVYRYDALQYINYGVFIWLLLGICLFLVIYLLFRYKDKPKNLYVVAIGGYLVVMVYLFMIFSYLGGLPNNVIDQKTIRGYRDIMMIIMGFQYVIIVIMFIRGLGFNIKKFNFEKDMQELNITNEDNEEVEVDVKIETDVIMRGVRKKKRELGYFYQEYKVFILGILAIIVIIFGYKGYKLISDKFMVYHQDEVIGNNNYITFKNSYYKMENNKNYIIIKFDVFKYGKKEQLDVNKLVLKVDKEEYKPNKNICYKFNKLGNCYKKQYITDSSNSYIITYEVDSLNSKKTYLLYNESYEKTYKIKLDLENYE